MSLFSPSAIANFLQSQSSSHQQQQQQQQQQQIPPPPPLAPIAASSSSSSGRTVSPQPPSLYMNKDNLGAHPSIAGMAPYNSTAPRCTQTLEAQPRRPITSICINESKLYAGDRNGSISEWDIPTGTLTRTFSPSHSKGVTSVCTSGSRLFSSSEDGTVVVWNLQTGLPIRTIRGHDGYVTSVCITPEGRLYSGGADRMINEWDPHTGRRLWILTGHTRWVLTLCAAGGRLYSGGNDHSVRVWDMETGRCLHVLEEHTDWVFSLCLGKDLLYSSSRDGTVKVWDTSTGQRLRTLKGHDEGTGVRSVCVAAGRLYSAGDDKAIVEWDVKSGKPTRTLGGHYGGVSCLAAGHDGKLYSGSGDCTVKVWEVVALPPGTRPLTPPAAPSSSNYDYPTTHDPSPNPRHSRLPTSPISPTSPTPETDDSIRDQLSKAQELLAKQNKLKFRLKTELTHSRTELATYKSLLSESQSSLARLSQVEEELAAAKELLVLYKLELQQSQDAHLSALGYIMKQVDEHYLQIELDLASVRHLLESPWTPLGGREEDGDLGSYMPKKVVKRRWERDEEWDSDVELPEDLAWWRADENAEDDENTMLGSPISPVNEGLGRLAKAAKLKGESVFSRLEELMKTKDEKLALLNLGTRTKKPSSLNTDDDDMAPEKALYRGPAKAPAHLTQVISNGEYDEDMDDDEYEEDEESFDVGNDSMNISDYQKLRWQKKTKPRKHSSSRKTRGASPPFTYSNDEEDDSNDEDPHIEMDLDSDISSALWTGPVKSRPAQVDTSMNWHSTSDTFSAPPEAEAALWKGAVKNNANGASGSLASFGGAGENSERFGRDTRRTGSLHLGPGSAGLRSQRPVSITLGMGGGFGKMSSMAGGLPSPAGTPTYGTSSGMTTPGSGLEGVEDLEGLIWNGPVKAGNPQQSQQVAARTSVVKGYTILTPDSSGSNVKLTAVDDHPLADAESVVWNGKVKGPAKADEETFPLYILPTPNSGSDADVDNAPLGSRRHQNSNARGSPPKLKKRHSTSVLSNPSLSPTRSTHAAGFGDHAKLPDSPSSSSSRTGSGSQRPHSMFIPAAILPENVSRPSSWLKPLQSLVETLGEQLVSPVYPTSPHPESNPATESSRLSTTTLTSPTSPSRREGSGSPTLSDSKARARRQMREMDEAFRDAVAAAVENGEEYVPTDSVGVKESRNVSVRKSITTTTTTTFHHPLEGDEDEEDEVAQTGRTSGMMSPRSLDGSTAVMSPIDGPVEGISGSKHLPLFAERAPSPSEGEESGGSHGSNRSAGSSNSNNLLGSPTKRTRPQRIRTSTSISSLSSSSSPTKTSHLRHHHTSNSPKRSQSPSTPLKSSQHAPLPTPTSTTPPTTSASQTLPPPLTPHKYNSMDPVSPRQASQHPPHKQQDQDGQGTTLGRMASAFENVLESAIDNPWNLMPTWLRTGTPSQDGSTGGDAQVPADSSVGQVA
ncbi:hypothetical protein HDV05_003667 [Chytridiales sp. JEL 0842]|nr:hypothetical protein HDV05_003667 [Chytridiales sp. JEL 0842]